MERIFKKRLSVRKRKEKEQDKVRDNPKNQRATEAEETNYILDSHGEDTEEPVEGDCRFCPRRSSHTLLDKSPFLGARLFPYRTWSSRRLSPHIRLPRNHRDICDHELMKKGTTIWRSKSASIFQLTDDFEEMSLEYSPYFVNSQLGSSNQMTCSKPVQCDSVSHLTRIFGQGDMPPKSLRAAPYKPKRRKRTNPELYISHQNTLITMANRACDPSECSSKADPPIKTEHVSASNTLPPSSHLQFSSTDSCCLIHSHSVPSLSKIPKTNLTQAASLPDMKLKEFTPDISADDFDDETYRFQCSCSGLYQCSVTGLVFVMKGEGDVVYRTVPWNRRLLAQHHKKPAGPLFDIKCLQQSVCQLNLPHCVIISTGGGQSLQVAHVNNEGIEFIRPYKITEAHVVINITGFSGYGIVKDKHFSTDPVRALVLLFYRPPDPTSFLNVLLLPRNIVIRDVQCNRRALIGDERYIDIPSKCDLHPNQVYILSTAPEDDQIKVQPKEAKFDYQYHNSSITSFQVILKRIIKDITLSLTDKSSSSCVWESEVCGLPTEAKTENHCPEDRLLYMRSFFIKRISEPTLNGLLDKLLEKKVISDAEREAVDAKQNRSEKICFVIDTVRMKGEAASLEMLEFLSKDDHFLLKQI